MVTQRVVPDGEAGRHVAAFGSRLRKRQAGAEGQEGVGAEGPQATQEPVGVPQGPQVDDPAPVLHDALTAVDLEAAGRVGGAGARSPTRGEHAEEQTEREEDHGAGATRSS